MALTNEQWWYLQWNGNDMYNEIVIVIMMRYLQWETDDIYDEALVVFTDEMRNDDIYMLNKFWIFTFFPTPLITKNLFFFCFFFVMP